MKLNDKIRSRLAIVAAAIVNEPELYRQHSTLCVNRSCGTPACVLGWAVFLFTPKARIKREPRHTEMCEYNALLAAGAKALGFSKTKASLKSADRIFDPNQWPGDFIAKYYGTAEGSKERALIAVERILHFIRTNGAE